VDVLEDEMKEVAMMADAVRRFRCQDDYRAPRYAVDDAMRMAIERYAVAIVKDVVDVDGPVDVAGSLDLLREAMDCIASGRSLPMLDWAGQKGTTT
jgi:hypothetical protein